MDDNMFNKKISALASKINQQDVSLYTSGEKAIHKEPSLGIVLPDKCHSTACEPRGHTTLSPEYGFHPDSAELPHSVLSPISGIMDKTEDNPELSRRFFNFYSERHSMSPYRVDIVINQAESDNRSYLKRNRKHKLVKILMRNGSEFSIRFCDIPRDILIFWICHEVGDPVRKGEPLLYFVHESELERFRNQLMFVAREQEIL